MRVYGWITALIMAAALGGCQTVQEEETADPSAEQAVLEAISQLEQAWATGDGAAFGEAFAGDALFMTWFGLSADGAGAIAAGHQAIFNGMYAGTEFSMSPTDIRFLSDDVALVRLDGWVHEAGSALPETPAQVRPLAVLQKNADGDWKLVAFQNTPVLNPAETGGDIRKAD